MLQIKQLLLTYTFVKDSIHWLFLMASRYPIARCLSRLVCVVFYLLSTAAAPARRACSPASPDELFLGRHPMLSEDFAFLCDGAENRLVKSVGMCA